MSIARQFDALLQDVCVGLGYCGSSVHVTDLIAKTGTLSSDEFGLLVLKAEYADVEQTPSVHHPHFQTLKKTFEKHLGTDEIDVAALEGITG